MLVGIKIIRLEKDVERYLDCKCTTVENPRKVKMKKGDVLILVDYMGIETFCMCPKHAIENLKDDINTLKEQVKEIENYE